MRLPSAFVGALGMSVACSETGLSPDPVPPVPPEPPRAEGLVPDAEPLDRDPPPRLSTDRERDGWEPPAPCSRRPLPRERLDALACPRPDDSLASSYRVTESWRLPVPPTAGVLAFILPPDPSTRGSGTGPSLVLAQQWFRVDLDRRYVVSMDRSLPRIIQHGLVWSDSSMVYSSANGALFRESGHEIVPRLEFDPMVLGSMIGQHPHLRRIVDLDRDGHLELVFGRKIFSEDGVLQASASFDDIVPPAVAS
jgi:hypothetical protein